MAEINSLNVNKNGHCYLELVEKSENSAKIIAKSRAIIWAYQYNIIRSYFEQTTGKKLESGLKVLLKALPQFHEIYSFSLIITDINPDFTLGDMALQRQKIIRQLQDEGIFELNKENQLSRLPKTIALISSSTAAGYGDFINHINNNPYGYKISIILYNAIMQGEACAASIIEQLEHIYEELDRYDAVLIMRGGGSKSNLSCFDDYELALNICHFPLPVIAGIGHERDQSIVDMVVHTSLKTPTAVADFLLSLYLDADSLIETYRQQLTRLSENILASNSQKLSKLNQAFFRQVYERLNTEKSILQSKEQKLRKQLNTQLNYANSNLDFKSKRLLQLSNNIIDKEKTQLNSSLETLKKSAITLLLTQEKKIIQKEKNLSLLNPENLLKRGYSILSKNGEIVHSLDEISIGDELINRIASGELKSIVQAIKKKN